MEKKEIDGTEKKLKEHWYLKTASFDAMISFMGSDFFQNLISAI